MGNTEQMTFEQRHADVRADPLEEMKRRLQPWATAPSSRGNALEPEACIVPKATVAEAIVLLEQLYEIVRLNEVCKDCWERIEDTKSWRNTGYERTTTQAP